MNWTNFSAIVDEAHAAGMAAVEKLKVVPMLVGQETYFGSGVMKPETLEFVEDGVCGFCWVHIKPEHRGNTKLGKEERATLAGFGFTPSWDKKTCTMSVSFFNQSLQKKEAYGRAYAAVLRAHGINARSESRID